MNKIIVSTLAVSLVGMISFGMYDLAQKREATSALIAQHSALLVRLSRDIAENLRFVGNHASSIDALDRGGFLDADTEPAATTELQSRLRRLVDESKLGFVSSRVLPTKTLEGLQLVGIRLDGTGELTALQQGLHALETAQPKLVVEHVAIAAAPQQAGSQKTGNRLLRWQLDVYAAIWKPEL